MSEPSHSNRKWEKLSRESTDGLRHRSNRSSAGGNRPFNYSLIPPMRAPFAKCFCRNG